MSLSRMTVTGFRLAFFVASVFILHLATTKPDYPLMEIINDKAGHILAFYVLAFLQDFSFPDGRFDLYRALSLMGYGLSIEVVQYFLPDRTFSLLDLASDVVGLAAYRISLPALKRFPLLRRRWNVET